MKVIHVLQSSRFSGAENVVCQIIKMFESIPEYEMVYVSRGGSIEPVLEQMGVSFYKLDKFDLKSLKKAIEVLKPDIVHAHDISASVLATLATMGKSCKLISHVHVNNSNMSKINLKTFLYGVSTIRYNHIFWVSQSCFDGFIFKNSVKKKSTVLCNVIDKSLILKKKNTDDKSYDYDIAYVGRLTEQKDPARLVNVLGKLISMRPNTKIAIAGTGDLEDYTRDIIKEKNIEANVTFFGFMNNPLKLLGSSKVMVMTSKYEGLPMTVLEAMALGVPIVSTPVDGLKDVIIQGFNGYLEDNDDTIASRLFDIISKPDLRERLSISAQKQFDRLNNLEEYKSKIQLIYEGR